MNFVTCRLASTLSKEWYNPWDSKNVNYEVPNYDWCDVTINCDYTHAM